MRKFLFAFIIIALNLSVFSQASLSTSLTACYSLNGNGTEPINNLTGTLSAVTPTVDRFNNPNSAFAFAGNNASFISLPNNSLLKANQISFSAWVRFNTMSAQIIAFAHNGCASYHEGYQLASTNLGPLGFRFQIAKSSNACSSGGQVILNGNFIPIAQTWYHIGFYAGPDSLKLYVNGNLDLSLANPNPLAYNAAANVYLGGTNLGVNLPFSGSIDNVRFYNRKLTGTEMNQLYTLDPSCLGGPVPVASFSISPTNVCVNQTISLTDLSVNTPTAWAWQMAGATPSVSSINNPVISFPASGNYTVSLISSNGFGSSTPITQTIAIKPLPIITTSANNTLICNGANAVLVANGANTYTWSNSQNFQAITVTPTVTTLYSVIGTATNGCQSSSSITVNVSPCTVLKQNSESLQVEIYPIPTSGKFVIEVFNEKINEFVLYDLLGQIVLKSHFDAGQINQIDISDKANGIYFLELKAEEKSITRKIIKE